MNAIKNSLRWKQRLENLKKTHLRLSKACSQESYNTLEVAGLIQTFEFTFELTWKTFKDLLEFEGYDVASPRAVIRTALEAKHISSSQCEILLDALGKRNLLTHTYDEDNVTEAQELILNEFEPVLTAIVVYLSEKNNNDC